MVLAEGIRVLKKNNLGFVSLFTGAGGFDLGLNTAGFKSLLSVEIDDKCRSTLKLNNPNVKLSSEGDIFKLPSSNIKKEAGIKKRELTLLVGGPPCQPFSKSSYWVNSSKSRMKDPRAKCLSEYMRVVNDLLPKVVVIENVSGIGYSNKNDGLNFIISKFKQINKINNTNYKPYVHIINSADYGVPQIRKRVFIVAIRSGEKFNFPPAMFCEEELCGELNLQKYRTTWDAIGDLDSDISDASLNVKGKWGDLLPSIPEGQNYLWHTNKMGGLSLFGWRTRYWSFLLKLSKTKPSWTITASPGPAIGPFHWKNRNLSIREMARIQTYPDTYNFSGSNREQKKQIGNSVPPALGELIGLEVRRQLFGSKVRRSLKLIPKLNEKSYKAERLRKVPEKYFDLIDFHNEHPGVGKGPGAKSAIKK